AEPASTQQQKSSEIDSSTRTPLTAVKALPSVRPSSQGAHHEVLDPWHFYLGVLDMGHARDTCTRGSSPLVERTRPCSSFAKRVGWRAFPFHLHLLGSVRLERDGELRQRRAPA